MEKQTNAVQHQVQQLPVTPTEKGNHNATPEPEEVLVLVEMGDDEFLLYTEEELVEIGFIKRGVRDNDGQLHDS